MNPCAFLHHTLKMTAPALKYWPLHQYKHNVNEKLHSRNPGKQSISIFMCFLHTVHKMSTLWGSCIHPTDCHIQKYLTDMEEFTLKSYIVNFISVHINPM